MTFENLNGWGRIQQRSRISRVLWSLMAVVAGIGGMLFAAGGTFAPPEVDRVRLSAGESYYINNFHIMYLAASVLLPAAGFFAWKAGHRGGLGLWRSTIRPAAMCGGAALVGLGLFFSSHLAMGAMQGLGIIVATIGAAMGLFFWILRGPAMELAAADAYWNRALALIFAGSTVVTGIGSGMSFHQWSRDHYRFERPGAPYTIEKVSRERWDSDSEDLRVEERTYRLPRLQFNPQPICASLLALFAFGSISEMRYRAGVARKARASFGRLY